MAFSGMWSKIDLMRMMNSDGGVESYTGARDMNEIIARAKSGDAYSELVINALVYQVASEIASQATALCGKIDAVAMIGEFAVDEFLAGAITEKISWITGRILRYSGEDELRIIANRALRALKGEETPNLCVKPPGKVLL
jgi:butyrate kinase